MQVQAKVGDDVHVKVNANPTTGYEWMVASNLKSFDGISIIANSYTQERDSNSMTTYFGQGGQSIMKFGILSTGDK